MMKQNIAVIFGGKSNEYAVSLQSAAAVIDHIDRSRYVPVLVGITKDGEWLLYRGGTEQIRTDSWHLHETCVSVLLSPCRATRGVFVRHAGESSLIPIDAVFPVMHGKNGEDGRLQGLLELAGLPYVGCDSLSSAICMDKAAAHTLVQATGISVPRSVIYDKQDGEARSLIASADLHFPLYIKPAKSGSSIGITKVSGWDEVGQAMEDALAHDDKVVIEEAVTGFEVGCALLGSGHDPIIGEIDEIELAGDFFNFHEKYTLATSNIHLPARIDQETRDRIKQTARQIYKTLGCTGLARVDLFLTPDQRIVFNEVNTMPGFTASSRYPNMLAAVGWSFQDIINWLIELAIARGGNE